MRIIILIFTMYLLFSLCSSAEKISKNFDIKKRIVQSKNYINGKFKNETDFKVHDHSFSELLSGHFKSVENKFPDKTVKQINLSKEDFTSKQNSTEIIWLGHSSLLIKIDGNIIVTDPVFSRRASPIPFYGPKSFNKSNPFKSEDIDNIDIVIISHDHYDHLDLKTISKIKSKVKSFIVPLGVGKILRNSGVEDSKITEFDWWEQKKIFNLNITATPSNHFSGRGLFDGDKTLWASWVIKSKNHSLFFGGDSGYSDIFKKIGTQEGPFDIAMLECGGYSKQWPDVHMFPEETVQANIDLQSNLLLPIHWAKFCMSAHPWTEPVEKVLIESKKKNVKVTTPVIGETIILNNNIPQSNWWK